jgi:PAS domain S-box-containing protein
MSESPRLPTEARLLDAIQQAVIATDLQGRVTYWNAWATHLFGWTAEEAIGQDILRLTPTDTSQAAAEELMARLTRGDHWAGDFPVRRKDGSKFTAFVVNSPILDADRNLLGVVGVSTDVSATRELEAQLRQAQKMEAVGRLAGGVAHDFNNLLTVILGNIEEVSADTATTAVQRARLDEARRAAQRAADLTGQLLSFSRKQALHPQPVDVPAALRAIEPMLRRLISEDIGIRLDIADYPMSVLIDPAQLDQLIINLAVNARDAMPRGGQLTITLEPLEDVSPFAPHASDGSAVALTVTDTGHGIAADILPHLFEPFLSTKQIGTGLGLATVHGIVQSVGGVIAVDNLHSGGASFRIVMPRIHGDAVEPARSTPVVNAMDSAGTTILLVEDEPTLRRLVERILRSAGFTVLACGDGQQALTYAERYGRAIDLVVTDIVMPNMNGVVLAASLRILRPGIRVLLMTGYAPEDVISSEDVRANHDLLRKPFSTQELLSAVSRVLGVKIGA